MLTYCLGAAAVFMVDAFVMFCAKNIHDIRTNLIKSREKISQVRMEGQIYLFTYIDLKHTNSTNWHMRWTKQVLT